ncbi:hypothetical protein EDB81DRAFT_903878 [Dactylonectria macrodidyma]|uniref:Shikimate dehydrogenase substrate binding N-terminal domain-containing protein n=1 Tax=Dactylonectria macrodidyma TaxID=307937 RepID=A0A9P9EAP4_9HYPO|nr:hypothetical protein EDB81DRAFT_903878 [Dactylonectria macrodidyma]
MPSSVHPSGDDLSPQQVSQLDRHGYVFGKKITHSLAPYLHNIVFQELGLRWGQVRLDSDDLPNFMELARSPSFFGAAVTMPNKVAILPYLDEMTDECRDIGACNTLYFRQENGRRIFCGTNTDCVGIRESFYQIVQEPDRIFHDRPALVIGGGGAARSAIYALRKWMRVTTIYLVNRDMSEVDAVIQDCTKRGYGDRLLHVKTVSQAMGLEAPGAIVACIPDFEPQTQEEIVTRKINETFLDKECKGVILEMCYNPTPFTRLEASARKKGWQVILGTEALIWQGIEQDKYWTQKPIDEIVQRKVQAAIAEKVIPKR